VIHFGQDGGKAHDGTLYLAFNTVVTPFIAPVVDLSSPQSRVSLVGNLITDGGAGHGNQVLVGARNGARTQRLMGSHNWLSGRFGADTDTALLDPQWCTLILRRVDFPLFVNPAQHDYHLTPAALQAARTPWTSDAIDLPRMPGLPEHDTEAPLIWQYRHPAGREKRLAENSPILGAYGRSMDGPQPR
jgi:hypothetical protein